MGIRKFQPPPPQNQNANKKFGKVDYVHDKTTYKSIQLGLMGKWVKYNKNYFYLYLFSFGYRSDLFMDFYVQWLKRHEITHVCAFLGL